jgi:signal transduction histidine kinase
MMARSNTRSFTRVAVDRIRQDRGLRPHTALVMIAFVVLVYIVIVVFLGPLLGTSGGPSLIFSVLATAVVAITFEPVRRRVKAHLARALHQDRMTPYQVLARFPRTVAGSYPAEQLPTRMAKVLAEGTGTARSEVWLAIRGRLELAASWPPGSEPGAGTDDPHSVMAVDECAATSAAPRIGLERPGDAPVAVVEGRRRSLAVRERGELLGALTVVVRDGQELTPVEERLFAGLAAQSGLMLRVAGLRADLEQQLADLQHRTAELRRARRDLITRQDAERQRLERNIHDGAQQEVLALLVNLRLAQTLLGRSPERGARLLYEQEAAAAATIQTLTALSRGLYPKLLTDEGPVAALRAAVAAGPIRVELTAIDLPRCAPQVEAALYFCCLEAVQNASKHSGGTLITVGIQQLSKGGDGERTAATDPDLIELTVTDDGRGFDTDQACSGGLANIRDRIESVQGTVQVSSSPGRGTTIRAWIPIAAHGAEPGHPHPRRGPAAPSPDASVIPAGQVVMNVAES